MVVSLQVCSELSLFGDGILDSSLTDVKCVVMSLLDSAIHCAQFVAEL